MARSSGGARVAVALAEAGEVGRDHADALGQPAREGDGDVGLLVEGGEAQADEPKRTMAKRVAKVQTLSLNCSSRACLFERAYFKCTSA